MDPRSMFNPYHYPYLMNNQASYPGMSNMGHPHIHPNPNDPQIHTNQDTATPTTITQHNENDSNPTEESPMLEKTPQSSREKSRWSNQDDILLCSAWLNISTDAVIGVDQGTKNSWGRHSNIL